MKICTRCSEAKVLSDFYMRDGEAVARCKACCRRAESDRRAADPLKFKARDAKKYVQSRGQALAREKVRRETKRTELVAYSKEYNAANREKLNDAGRVYYAANRAKILLAQKDPARKAKINARARSHYGAHPEKMAVRNMKRHRSSKRAPGVCSAEQLKARFEFYGNCCAYCGNPAQAADHVIALNRGGSNWPANLRPTCTSCNSSKRDKKLMSEWKPSVAVAA